MEPAHQNDPEVSTEAQRRMLDEMSRQLVQKLNEMIAEQEARVRSFTAQQHSLSSIPTLQQQPEVRPQPVYQRAEVAAPKPPVPQPAPQRTVQDAPPLPFDRPARPQPAKSKEESSGSSGWIITVIVFIIFVLLRSCD